MKFNRSVAPGPERLALCRILTCVMCICFYFRVDFAAYCSLPDEFWDPISLFKYLHIPRMSSSGVVSIQLLFLVSLGLCALGVAARLSATVAMLASAYLLGFVNCFGKVTHGSTVVPFVLFILAASRCGDAFVAWPRPRHEADREPARQGDYAWPIQAVWILFGLIFCAAGVAKLRYAGLDWIVSEHMSRVIRIHFLSPDQPPTELAHWIADSHFACIAMASGTIVLETLAPLVVFSRWARILIVPAIAAMLLGMWMLLGFFFYTYSILFIWFIPFDRVMGRATTDGTLGGDTTTTSVTASSL